MHYGVFRSDKTGYRVGKPELNWNKNRGAVVNRALKKCGYLHCLRNVTFLPFSKYTKKGVSDYILCIARV